MQFSAEVQSVAAKSRLAVESLASGELSVSDRRAIYEQVEQLKESPIALQCSLCLASMCDSPTARCLGLQIIENIVKYHWNDIIIDDKILIKECVLQLMMSASEQNCPSHVTECLSRPLVEIVKREWPQQYGTFFTDLDLLLSSSSPLQWELFIRLVLRLCEDVATFQTMEAGTRRRELLQSLVTHSQWLWQRVLRVLSSCVNTINKQQQQQQQRRLCQLSLSAAGCCVQWTSLSHVMGDEGVLLLPLLLQILTDSPSSSSSSSGDSSAGVLLSAAECLLNLFSRHGKTEERAPLLAIFEPEAVTSLSGVLQALQSRTQMGAVLRLVCESMSAAVSQLTHCWSRDYSESVSAVCYTMPPSGLPQFLQLMLSVCQHETSWAPLISLLPAWLQLLRHPSACCSAPVVEVLPALFRVLCTRTVHTFSCNTSVAAVEESSIEVSYSHVRADISVALRLLVEAAPLSTAVLMRDHVLAVYMPGQATQHVRPSLAHWQALVFVVNNTTRRLAELCESSSCKSGDKGVPVLDVIVPVLDSCLQRRIEAETSSSSVPITACYTHHLSVVSSLGVFVSHAPHLLPSLLAVMFTAVTWQSVEEEGLVSHASRCLRQHGCNALSSLAAKHPSLLWLHFSTLLADIQRLLSNSSLSVASSSQSACSVGLHETVSLTELLVAVHAHGADYQQRCGLLEQLLAPWQVVFEQLASCVSSTDTLVSSMGLQVSCSTQQQQQNDADDQCYVARARLNAMITLLNALMLRSKLTPAQLADKQTMLQRHLVDASTNKLRNPCAPHVAPHLPTVFQLIRTLHQLRSSSYPHHAQLHELLQLPASVRNSLIYGHFNGPPPGADSAAVLAPQSDPLSRVRCWLVHVHELVLALLKNAAITLGHQLFSVAHVREYFGGSVLHCVDTLPDFWIRQQIRSVWRPMSYLCPVESRAEFLLPLLSVLLSSLVERLDTRWQQAELSSRADNNDHCDQDLEAVLADQILRQLTVESVQLLKMLLVSSGRSSSLLETEQQGGEQQNGHNMEDNVEMEVTSSSSNITSSSTTSSSVMVVSDLGRQILQCSATMSPALVLLFKLIGWGDSGCSQKACQLVPAVVEYLSTTQSLDNDTICRLFGCVLHGFEVHGHQACNIHALCCAAVVTYTALRPNCAQLDNVLQAIPGVNAQCTAVLHEKLMNHAKISRSDKLKRDVMKNMLAPLIGCSINQLFSKKVAIRDLLPLVKPAKCTDKNNDNNEVEALENICSLFSQS